MRPVIKVSSTKEALEKNEEIKNEKAERAKEALGDFWKKTKDVSKKAAQKAQEEAKKLGEQMEQKKQEREQEKYNPLFESEFKSKKFSIPTVIKIVDDAAMRKIDVCEGAIGWRQIYNDVEVLYLNHKFVSKCGLTFITVASVNEVYCVDNFDKTKYINVNSFFEKINNEKMAELERIAYSLGAKCFSVEIIESDAQSQSAVSKADIGIPKFEASTSVSEQKKNVREQSGKTVTRFEGDREPVRPTLKWFADDDSINNLINMRCDDKCSIKSKTLELNGASSMCISKGTAIAIDNALGTKLKGGVSAEHKVSKELSKTLIFVVEF